MRTAVLAALLAVCLLVAPAAKSSPLQSIRPVQMEMVEADGSTHKQVVCTAWASLYEEQLAWVTAAHCVVDPDSPEPNHIREKTWVDGVEARPVVVNFDEDIAVLRGGPRADPLALSVKHGSPFDVVWGAGYPMGSERQHVTMGWFSVVSDDDGRSNYNVAVAPGMSGGPIIDKASGMVVGMFLQTECPRVTNWCPISRGPALARMRLVVLHETED